MINENVSMNIASINVCINNMEKKHKYTSNLKFNSILNKKSFPKCLSKIIQMSFHSKLNDINSTVQILAIYGLLMKLQNMI